MAVCYEVRDMHARNDKHTHNSVAKPEGKRSLGRSKRRCDDNNEKYKQGRRRCPGLVCSRNKQIMGSYEDVRTHSASITDENCLNLWSF